MKKRTATRKSFIRRSLASLMTILLVCVGLVVASWNEAQAVPFLESEEAVLAYSPSDSGTYVGSPTLEVLDDGTYVAASTRFGSGATAFGSKGKRYTEVLRSTDKGATWSRTAVVEPMFWATVFQHEGSLYLMGVGSADEYDDAVISKSTDGGLTWSEPVVLLEGTYHTGDTPVAVANGRIYKSYEHYLGGSWGNFRSLIVSAPVDADLLDPDSWTATNEGSESLVLEGNPIVDRDGNVLNLLRWHNHPTEAFSAQISADGTTLTEGESFTMPRGVSINKFYILFDDVSDRYLLVGNPETEDKFSGLNHHRNVLALYESEDLQDWNFVTTLVTDDQDLTWEQSVRQSAFSQPTIQIDGNDLLLVSRTAYEGAQGNHNTNQMTFHRFADFRSWLGQGDETLHLGFDDPSDLGKDTSAGTAVTGDVTGGNSVASGVYGSAYRPQSRGIDLGNTLHPTLWGATGISVTAWSQADTSISQAGVVLQSAINSSVTGVELSIRPATDGNGLIVRAEVRPSKSSTAVVRTIDYPSDGQWHHVAMSADLEGNALRLYIDGEEKDPEGAQVTFDSSEYKVSNPTAHDRVGSATSGALFEGNLDEVSAYRTALSSEEIANLASLEGPVLEKVLVDGEDTNFSAASTVQVLEVAESAEELVFVAGEGTTASPQQVSLDLTESGSQTVDVTLLRNGVEKKQTFTIRAQHPLNGNLDVTSILLSDGTVLYPSLDVANYEVIAASLPGKTPTAVTVKTVITRAPNSSAQIVQQADMSSANPQALIRITAEDGTSRDIFVNFSKVEDDVVGHWTFDDEECCTWTDSSAYGRNASGNGEPTTGIRGGAVSLAGESRIVLGDTLHQSLSGAAAVSVAGWIRPTALASSGENNFVFGTRIDQQKAGIDIVFDGKNLRVAGRSNANDGYQRLTFPYPNDGAWHHIAATLDYANSKILLYIDGKEVTALSGANVLWSKRSYTPGTPTNPSTIGGSPSGGNYFTGQIDDVRIVARGLTAEEISSWSEREGQENVDATACDQAAQAEGMTLIQQVKLPQSVWSGVYDYDASSEVGDFDRVGYCLELTDKSGGNTDYVYASMDAYTEDATALGIPSTKEDIRRLKVSGLEVESNVAGVSAESGTVAYLEMWNLNYDKNTSGQVAGASDAVYDFDDRPMNNGSYGSFQIHAVGSTVDSSVTPSTLLAVNGWNSGVMDVGIGTQTDGANPDWTFAKNAAKFSERTLSVFVQESPVSLEEYPETLQLYPRDDNNQGHVVIAGVADESVTNVSLVVTKETETAGEVRSVSLAGGGTFSLDVPIAAELSRYSAELRITVNDQERTIRQWDGLVAGDVIVLQGQSNAEAMGRLEADEAANDYINEYVRSFGTPDQNALFSVAEHNWNYAQAYVGSVGGSRWNAGHVGLWGLKMGSEIVAETGVPVAVINGARGGQTIEYFAENAADRTDSSTNYGRLYQRLDAAGLLGSVSALFFYQGESDHDRASQHLSGYGKLLENWTRDYAKNQDANEIQYYAFQVRNSCAVQTTGLTLREAQRTLASTFSDYRVSVLSTSGIPEHDGCHYPFVNGYEDIASIASGSILNDLYGAEVLGVKSPNVTEILAQQGSPIVRIYTDSTEDLIITGNPAADFSLSGTGSTVERIASEGQGVIRMTLSSPVDSEGLSVSYLGHNGTGPTIATSKHAGLLMFKDFPVTVTHLDTGAATLAALAVGGEGVDGFDPGVTEYSKEVASSNPSVEATATDPAATIETKVLYDRVEVRVTSADGTETQTYTVWLTYSNGKCASISSWLSAGWGGTEASKVCALGDAGVSISDGNAGVWTNSDSLTTVYGKALLSVGDAFEARLDSLGTSVNSDSRAGLIVRNSLAAGKSGATGYATLVVAGGGSTFMQSDTSADGMIDWEGSKTTGVRAPVYLRVVRTGETTLEGFYRSDAGSPWTSLGTALLSAPLSALDVGVFANSNRSSSTLETATFSQMRLIPSGENAVQLSAVEIDGEGKTGTTLTAVPGEVMPAEAELSYQWLRDGAAIAGATASTYALEDIDAGTVISVQANAASPAMVPANVISEGVEIAEINPLSLEWIQLSGKASPGGTLTASTVVDPSDVALTYQWLRDGIAINGETSSSYRVASDDTGSLISVRVTATSPGRGSGTITSSSRLVSALLGLWSFNEDGDTTTFADTLGSERTIGATVSRSAGPIGQALAFPGGARGVFSTPRLATEFNGASGIGVSAWIHPEGLSAQASGESSWVFGSRIDAKKAGIDINFSGALLRVAARSQASDPYQYQLFDYPLDGRWHHIAASIDYANDRIDLYLDGVLQTPTGDRSVSFGSDSYVAGTPSEPDTIGGSPEWGVGTFIGGIDEVRIQASTVSAEEAVSYATADPQTAVLTLSPAQEEGQWSNSDVQVSVASNVLLPTPMTAEYRVGADGEWTVITENEGSFEPLAIVDSGKNAVQVRMVTARGVGEITQTDVWIDKDAPTVELGASTDDAAGRAVISVSATDSLSGIATVELKIGDGEWETYSAPVELTQAGTYSVQARAVDNAGNEGVATPIDVIVAHPAITVLEVPEVEGDAVVDQVVTVSGGSYIPADSSQSYQWFADGEAIIGADQPQFVPTAQQIGSVLTVQIRVSHQEYQIKEITVEAGTVVAADFVVSALPTISGEREVGATLQASEPQFVPGGSQDPENTITYQWTADGEEIAGATGLELTLTDDMAGKEIALFVGLSRLGYNAQSFEIPAGIVGTPRAITLSLSASTVRAGQSLLVSASGLTEGGDLRVSWHEGRPRAARASISEGTVLLEGQADSGGGFQSKIVVPKSVAPGEYHVKIVDLETGLTASAPLAVLAEEGVSGNDKEPAQSGGSLTEPAGSETGQQDTQEAIASTGMNGAGILIAILGVSLAGGIALIAGSRFRRRH